jgi:FMN phosphatase YigB (HAD superfamily)
MRYLSWRNGVAVRDRQYIDGVPVLVCSLANVVFEVSFTRPLLRWQEVNEGLLGVQDPGALADRELRAFEVGALGESEYARHLRALLRWQGGDPELVEIFGDAFGPVDLDVVQLLDDLRHEDWRLVGVMNTNPWHERVWRELHGETLRLFDRVLTSTELGLRIPDPRFYGEALRQVPREGYRLVVDDRPESVSAARAVGLDAHLFRGAAGMSSACQALAAPAL